MGKKVTKAIFEKVVSEEVARLFGPLGFDERKPGAFERQCGRVVHGFGFTPNPSVTHFHVPVGPDVPVLHHKLDYVSFAGDHYPTLLVSRWLGELKNKFDTTDVYYHFATVEELRAKIPIVYADFVEQAEPWLAGLVTIEAVAEEFFKWRIAPPEPGLTRPPDPFAWAIYGWLLQESGDTDAARPWLDRALQELCRPRYHLAGQIVSAGTKGARHLQLEQAEQRLQEVLERDLGK